MNFLYVSFGTRFFSLIFFTLCHRMVLLCGTFETHLTIYHFMFFSHFILYVNVPLPVQCAILEFVSCLFAFKTLNETSYTKIIDHVHANNTRFDSCCILFLWVHLIFCFFLFCSFCIFVSTCVPLFLSVFWFFFSVAVSNWH